MQLHFPWESRMLMESPWIMQISMIIAALALSLISWYRYKHGK